MKIYFLFILVFTILVACDSNSHSKITNNQASNNYGELIGVARSVGDSFFIVIIKFYEDNQYTARFSSDVGSMNEIDYSGYYQFLADGHFVLMSPFFDSVYFDADEQGIFTPENYSNEDALGSGLRLEMEMNPRANQ